MSDEAVRAVPVAECGEGLTSVPVSTCDHSTVRNTSGSKFWCRESVAAKLVAANRLLPDEFDLVVIEGHRPVSVQQRYWDEYSERIRQRSPSLSTIEVEAETAKFVAPASPSPPHSTGGAVDVVLHNESGEELDMGSPVNRPCPEMATAASVPLKARKNRDLLVQAMTSAGFVNYDFEWWHFSYGDRMWAYKTCVSTAIYDSINP